jgi:hypothetical protein
LWIYLASYDIYKKLLVKVARYVICVLASVDGRTESVWQKGSQMISLGPPSAVDLVVIALALIHIGITVYFGSRS